MTSTSAARILKSSFPDVPVPEVDLTSYVLGAEADPRDQRIAVLDAATGRSLTFAKLRAAVTSLAQWLHADAERLSQVCALFAANCAEYPLVFHGVLAAGQVVTPVNALYTADELARQLRDSRGRTVFCDAERLPRTLQAADQLADQVRRIVVIDEAPTASDERIRRLSDASTSQTSNRLQPPAHDSLAVIPFSSGTTGIPKGVMLTHRNLVANQCQIAPLLELPTQARTLAVLPLSHIYAMTGIMNASLAHRVPMVTMPRFTLDSFLAAIEQHRITHAFVVPPIATALLAEPNLGRYDLSSLELVMCAAASLSTGVAEQLQDALGAVVVQAYGLSEASPCTHGIPPSRPDIHRGSIGLLMPNVEARLVDPTGTDAATGHPGELWCRGPNVMAGYLDNPQATADVLDEDGWLHTGDLASADEHGTFTIVGRLKELIKYNGYQVAPTELETVLLQHPAIADAAVIGVPDDTGNELPKAFVVTSEAYRLTPDDVITFSASRLAPFKKIRLVQFVDAIPRSATGKILRGQLRSLPAPVDQAAP